MDLIKLENEQLKRTFVQQQVAKNIDENSDEYNFNDDDNTNRKSHSD